MLDFLASFLYAWMYLWPIINWDAVFPPGWAKASSICLKASAYASAFKITASALPSAIRICAYLSASAILILAIISPSDIKILALFFLSESAYLFIAFSIPEGASMSLISYLMEWIPHSFDSISIAATIFSLSFSLS